MARRIVPLVATPSLSQSFIYGKLIKSNGVPIPLKLSYVFVYSKFVVPVQNSVCAEKRSRKHANQYLIDLIRKDNFKVTS